MRTIVIAPHPDDEVLGVGGTILRRKHEGSTIAWLIVTAISKECGFSEEKIQSRHQEIKNVSEKFGFDDVFFLNFPTTKLDNVPIKDLVSAISNVFLSFEPDEVFVPHYSDVHTDHKVVFDAAISCTKWFRYPSIKRVLAYETLSETEFCLNNAHRFCPNVFFDITNFLDKKLNIMKMYASELGDFPFPRSDQTIRALAALRGSSAGFLAAEAFELLREIS